MSLHPFKPVHFDGNDEEVFATDFGAFSEADINGIIRRGELMMMKVGKQPTAFKDGVRQCDLSWIGKDDNTDWLYDRLEHIIAGLNAQHFQFDLFGFVEDFQYTSYEPGAFFDWHMDKRQGTASPRKLSVTVQLSNPDEYEGGVVQVRTSSAVRELPKQKGAVIAFPSWLSHQVTPVTRGVRRSLVIWVAGPDFK